MLLHISRCRYLKSKNGAAIMIAEYPEPGKKLRDRFVDYPQRYTRRGAAVRPHRKKRTESRTPRLHEDICTL